ncbi:alpha/beta hydrolase [Mesorhizobium sp. B2-3-4]|uniref:alpha/beta fold hydrolase n=1 Tax=Mesorhizobium sp. B2-3-4 TaxID=2589959 RepID=UPI001FEEC46A|nr:alpha/beta hydrolase [Mesorhizobium sp. B2-3-4]
MKAKNYSTGSVTSRDGTVIGYRRMGSGPGLILLHGGMQAAQNLMKLAAALSDAFAVYVPDRRGRGLSRPFGDNHGVEKEVQDLEALMAGTGARDVFGLSAGALIALRATLELATLRKVALYEPPLAIDGAPSPMAWVPRYEKELAKGDLAAAMVSCMRGTGDPSIIRMPRFVLVPLMRLAIRTDAASEARSEARDDVPLDVLIRSVHFDARLAAQMEGTVENFKAVGAEILLIGGDRSTAYLRAALNALAGILPNATRIELPGLGHIAADDAGQPERVAGVLRPFFSGDVPFRA